MKILISGVTGFIGQNLSTSLLKGGHEICAIVRPSTNIDSLKEKKIEYFIFDNDVEKLVSFLKKEKFDGVVHLASLFLAAHKTEDIKNLISSNVLFSSLLLEASVQSEIRWFINTGTFWQHYKNSDYSPVNLYAATKQAFEDIAKYYIETSTVNFVTLKLSDTFGPGDTRPKIFNLWQKIARSGESLDMSPGEQIIDISYIDNITDGYIRLINLVSKDSKRKLSGQSFAVSSDQKMSLKKLAAAYEKITNSKLNINWGKRDYRPREVMVPWNKGKRIPGWKPKITIAKGIKKLI